MQILITENKDVEKFIKMKDNLELEVIDFKLKNTELELKIENLEKKLNKKQTNKNKLQFKLLEIFDWYKSAMPNTKLKFKNNEYIEPVRNLESEIINLYK